MKNFLATKDIIKKVRIQPTEWEKNLQTMYLTSV